MTKYLILASVVLFNAHCLCIGQILEQHSAVLIPEPGVPLIRNALVQKELSLTQEQKHKLVAIDDEWKKYFVEVKDDGKALVKSMLGMSDEEQVEVFNDFKALAEKKNKEFRDAIDKVLTQKQERRFRELLLQYHLQKERYELAFLLLEIEYGEVAVKSSNKTRKQEMDLAIARTKLHSQLGWLTSEFGLKYSKGTESIGRVFSFKSGESADRLKRKTDDAGNRRRTADDDEDQ